MVALGTPSIVNSNIIMTSKDPIAPGNIETTPRIWATTYSGKTAAKLALTPIKYPIRIKNNATNNHSKVELSVMKPSKRGVNP